MSSEHPEPITLTVSNRRADSLRALSEHVRSAPAQVLGTLLDALLEETPWTSETARQGVRLGYRKRANLPCVLRLTGSAKDSVYKTARLVDVALGGMGIAVEDMNKSRETMARESYSFEVTLQLEGDDLPTSFTCRTCYVHRNGTLRMGGALLAGDPSTLRAFFKIFMRLVP